MKQIKVHYWHVLRDQGQPVAAVLRSLKDLGIEDRLKECGNQKVRLDEISEHPQSNGKVFWSMKFCRFRDDNWPSVAAITASAKDLELEDDESLSEETLAVYCEESERLVVQYNHFGVRAAKIKDYLNLVSGDVTYTLAPVLTNEAQEKYQRKQIVTGIEAVIEGVNEADIAFLEGSGLEDALSKSVANKVTSFRFSFSVDARARKSKVERTWITKIVEGISRRDGDRDTLLVSAKENEDDAVEIIDLLESRKVTAYNADLIDRTLGRRYDATQLYGLLEQSMREWIG